MTQQTDTATPTQETQGRTLNDVLLDLPVTVIRALFEALVWVITYAGKQTWRLIRWAAPRYPEADALVYTVAWLYADALIGVTWRPDAPWWVNTILVAANPIPASMAFLTWWYWNDHAPESMDDYVAVWRSDIAGTLLDDDGLEEWARG